MSTPGTSTKKQKKQKIPPPSLLTPHPKIGTSRSDVTVEGILSSDVTTPLPPRRLSVRAREGRGGGRRVTALP